ncbi:MAG: hypothetical protein C0614_00350 [Desulfuromonas sp.]|nr:MAG: hypothetical protein C0614_00350 [Desulfuromonas sp.]
MNRILLLPLLLVLALSLAGCETMKGFGKDVESAGEWVQDKASQ